MKKVKNSVAILSLGLFFMVCLLSIKVSASGTTSTHTETFKQSSPVQAPLSAAVESSQQPKQSLKLTSSQTNIPELKTTPSHTKIKKFKGLYLVLIILTIIGVLVQCLLTVLIKFLRRHKSIIES